MNSYLVCQKQEGNRLACAVNPLPEEAGARERPGCLLMPVNISAGASESRNGAYYGVPKRDLLTGLQVLLQSGGLQIAAGMPYGAALVEEMAEMRAKVTPGGNTQFGAWREVSHDDLVLGSAEDALPPINPPPRLRW